MKVDLKLLKRMKMTAVVLGMAAAGVCYGCNSGRGADQTEMILEMESGAVSEAAGSEDGAGAAAGNSAGRQEGQDAAGNDTGQQRGQGAAQQSLTGTTGGESHLIYYVHVCGAVVNPGVYQLEPGSRIWEAVDQAGGFGPEAAQSYLNLAQEAADGMKIQVPTIKEAPEWEKAGRTGIESGSGMSASGIMTSGEAAANGTAAAGGGKVNLNTASKDELMTLKGIGETKAEDIIRYREAYGPFEKIEDIKNISGIKDAAFQKIKDSITV